MEQICGIVGINSREKLLCLQLSLQLICSLNDKILVASNQDDHSAEEEKQIQLQQSSIASLWKDFSANANGFVLLGTKSSFARETGFEKGSVEISEANQQASIGFSYQRKKLHESKMSLAQNFQSSIRD